jgi:hypothetical protein
MIALLRWLTRSDYAVGPLHLSPQQIAEWERWTKAQQDGAIVRHARRDHSDFWAGIDRREERKLNACRVVRFTDGA